MNLRTLLCAAATVVLGSTYGANAVTTNDFAKVPFGDIPANKQIATNVEDVVIKVADAIDKKAPTTGSYIYFQRNDFSGRVLKPGMAVKFRIFYFGLILRESTNLPFQYADDYLYYYGNVMPDYLLNN